MSYEHARTSPDQRIGWGFVFGQGLVGIDLDDCIVNGKPNPIAKRILDLCNGSYAELSQSKNGVKIWILGQKRNPICNVKIAGFRVEIYDSGKWFMVTGKQLKMSSAFIRNGQEAIDYIESFMPEKKVYAPINTSVRNESKALNIVMSHPPSVAGQGGHRTLFTLGLKLMRCGLTDTEVYDLISSHYNSRCEPHWSEFEIQHKVRSCRKVIQEG